VTAQVKAVKEPFKANERLAEI